jgi:proteasome lid subunit RPN8/RPN11
MIERTDVPRGVGSKRFEIAATTPAYEVKARPLDRTLRALDGRAFASAEADRSYALYMEPGASRDLMAHIEWGRDSDRNRVEQGGLLLGQVCTDPDSSQVYGVVEAVIPGDRAKGSGAYLLMDHDTWKAMLDRADELNAAAGDAAMQVIGWYHTHPNELSVFLSGTDRATQARMFSQPWQFAIVLNPQKKLWRVFHGAEALECVGFMPVTR